MFPVASQQPFRQQYQDGSILLQDTSKIPQVSIIWMHGFGDSARGFQPWWTMTNPPSPIWPNISARIKLLQAPVRAGVMSQGQPCNSWYDIDLKNSLYTKSDADLICLQHLDQCTRIIEGHIEEQFKYWSQLQQNSYSGLARRIVIGGFSQGCGLALYEGMRSKYSLGGIIGYSGRMFDFTPLNNLGKTPVLLFHGTADNVLPESISRQSYSRLLGHPSVTYVPMQGMAHSVDPTGYQMTSTVKFLQQVILNAQGKKRMGCW